MAKTSQTRMKIDVCRRITIRKEPVVQLLVTIENSQIHLEAGIDNALVRLLKLGALRCIAVRQLVKNLLLTDESDAPRFVIGQSHVTVLPLTFEQRVLHVEL